MWSQAWLVLGLLGGWAGEGGGLMTSSVDYMYVDPI